MTTAACVLALLMAGSPAIGNDAPVAPQTQTATVAPDVGSPAPVPQPELSPQPDVQAAPLSQPEQTGQADLVPPASGVDLVSPAPDASLPPETSSTGEDAAPAVAPPPQDGGGVIVVTGRGKPPKEDPAQAVNAVSYQAVQAVDKVIIGPIAHGYEKGVPRPVRKGLHNLLNNLDEPIVFVNFLLQLKPGKAAETLGRFTINSTLGVAGLFDVAKKKPFRLPRRSNGLADTLGYYGIGPGPYLFLPLIGSTTVRDGLGRIIDLSLVPTIVGKPFNDPTFALAKGALSSLDERAEFDADLKKLRTAPDPYSAQRAYYLQRRQAEIDVLRGKRDNADVDVDAIVRAAPGPAAASVPPPAQ